MDGAANAYAINVSQKRKYRFVHCQAFLFPIGNPNWTFHQGPKTIPVLPWWEVSREFHSLMPLGTIKGVSFHVDLLMAVLSLRPQAVHEQERRIQQTPGFHRLIPCLH